MSMKRFAKKNKQKHNEKSVKELCEKPENLWKEEPLMTAEYVDISIVPARFHSRIRAMLNRHHSMWPSKLGEINTTEHAIYIKPGSRQVPVPPYRGGPKTRELEQAVVDQKLRDGFIEPATSEWTSPSSSPRRRLHAMLLRGLHAPEHGKYERLLLDSSDI